MNPLLTFAPDFDPAQEGVIVSLTDMQPTRRGYKAMSAPVDAGLSALAAEANSLSVLKLLDGSRRVFAGTASNIYENAAGSWTSRASGFSIGVNRWKFSQFGTVSLAAAKAETLQASTSTTFAAVAGAPKASHMDVSEGFVMLADTNDGTYGDQPDRWWCSAYLDYTDWTPAVSTQCATGRLVDAPGPIYALKSFGSGFVAYKERAMLFGSYVGAPTIFNWVRIPGDVGTIMADGVVNIGSAHVFIGPDDIYLFDGSRPIPIGDPVRNWFFDDLSQEYAYRTIGVYDQITGIVMWFYVSSSNDSTTPDKVLLFHAPTRRFGVGVLSVEAAGLYYEPGITYEGLGSLYSTYDDLPTDLAYDSPVWNAARPSFGVIKSDHTLYTLTGKPGSTQLITGEYGDYNFFSTVQRVVPRFLQTPDSATLYHQYSDAYGVSFTQRDGVALYENKWDTLWHSRWHRFLLQFSGYVEINGVEVVSVQEGDI